MKAAPQTLGEQIGEIVAAMRAGGVGRMKLGALEVDLTAPPAQLASTEPARVETEDERAHREAERFDRIALAHSGGKRVPLPFHGVRRTG